MNEIPITAPSTRFTVKAFALIIHDAAGPCHLLLLDDSSVLYSRVKFEPDVTLPAFHFHDDNYYITSTCLVGKRTIRVGPGHLPSGLHAQWAALFAASDFVAFVKDFREQASKSYAHCQKQHPVGRAEA